MTRYAIDSETSTVTFSAKTSLHPVVATAPASGWFEAELTDDGFAEGTTISGTLSIPVDALRSGNPIYDAETRRRINVKANPVIEAEIASTKSVEGDTARVEGSVRFHGEAALLEGEVVVGAGPILTGESSVDIRWWDLHPPRLLAFRVEPEVTIAIDLELVEVQ